MGPVEQVVGVLRVLGCVSKVLVDILQVFGQPLQAVLVSKRFQVFLIFYKMRGSERTRNGSVNEGQNCGYRF